MYGATDRSKMEDVDRLSQSGSSNGDLLAGQFRPERRTVILGGVRVRLPNDLENIEIVFLVFAAVSILGAAIVTFVKIGDFPTSSSDFVYAILLLVNLGFVAFYVLSGILLERPYEVVVSLLAVVVVMLYCIVEYAAFPEKRTDLKLGRLIGICILGPADIAIGILVVRRYFEGPTGLMVKIVGGNISLQGICKLYFVFCAFVKFDFQVVVSLLVFLVTDGHLSLKDQLIIGIGVPFSFFWLLLGLFAARYEKRILSYLFFALSVAEPAYIIYLFSKFGKHLSDMELLRGQSHAELVSRDAAIIASGVVGLAVRVGLVIMMIKVTRNFGRGLRERLDEES